VEDGMRRRGITLVEVLIVVVVIALMTVFALPSFNRMRGRWRVETVAQQLVGDLHRARVEALKRNDFVDLDVTGTSTYTIRFLGGRTLPDGAAFADDAPAKVRFAAFGPALTGAATYEVQLDGYAKEIHVNAAGFAAIR
jgi:type IV fimbrial biogenesis protein FimT